MNKYAVCSILLCVVVWSSCTPGITSGIRQALEMQIAAESGHYETVYITDYGTKYHLIGCQFLQQSRIRVSREYATEA